MITTSESTAALFTAVHAAQSSGLLARKSRENTQINSKYATMNDVIESLLPALREHKLGFMQFMGEIKTCGTIHAAGITTRIFHTSGEWIQAVGNFPLPTPPKSKGGFDILNYSQTHGLALTYARRYALLSALGIAVGDEDDAERLLDKSVRQAPGQHYEKDVQWQDYANGLWRHEENPEDRMETLGDLTPEALRLVRKKHGTTNAPLIASVADEIFDMIHNNGEDYATAKKPNPHYPETLEELSLQQIREFFSFLKTAEAKKTAPPAP